jgi:hypothetical protein
MNRFSNVLLAAWVAASQPACSRSDPSKKQEEKVLEAARREFMEAGRNPDAYFVVPTSLGASNWLVHFDAKEGHPLGTTFTVVVNSSTLGAWEMVRPEVTAQEAVGLAKAELARHHCRVDGFSEKVEADEPHGKWLVRIWAPGVLHADYVLVVDQRTGRTLSTLGN